MRRKVNLFWGLSYCFECWLRNRLVSHEMVPQTISFRLVCGTRCVRYQYRETTWYRCSQRTGRMSLPVWPGSGSLSRAERAGLGGAGCLDHQISCAGGGVVARPGRRLSCDAVARWVYTPCKIVITLCSNLHITKEEMALGVDFLDRLLARVEG